MEERPEVSSNSNASPEEAERKRLLYRQFSLCGLLLSILLFGALIGSMMLEGWLLSPSFGSIQFFRFLHHSAIVIVPLQIAGIVFGFLSLRNRESPGISILLGVLFTLFWGGYAFNAKSYFTYKYNPATNDCLVIVATAVEQYALDKGEYPPALAPFLTTPTPYLRRIPRDPYGKFWRWPPLVYESDGRRWVLLSRGPDTDVDFPFAEWRATEDEQAMRELREAYSLNWKNGINGDLIKMLVDDDVRFDL